MREKLLERLAGNLSRFALNKPSVWAEKYRVMAQPYPGPFSFKYHPWAREMHDTKAEYNVGMKAAQMGMTEAVLNLAFYTNDILKQDVLYVLPNQVPDATNFSASRFDSALLLSDHLASVYSEVNNTGHKKAGFANMFIRGSNGDSGLKSISTPKIFIDELEECEEKNIPLAFERASGQLKIHRLIYMISTPKVNNHGIDKFYQDTTKEHFFFNCPHCSKLTELIFPECLVIVGEHKNDPRLKESYYKCKECKHKLDQELKPDWLKSGKWVAEFPNRDWRGFHIPQMYSMTIGPEVIALAHFKAMEDAGFEQQLWNSKLGLPHETAGARVQKEEVAKAIGQYPNGKKGNQNQIVTLGMDVGKRLHIVIKAFDIIANGSPEDINANAKSTVLFAGTRSDFESVDQLMHEYQVDIGVCDANPERRKAHELAMRFPGRFFNCFYGNSSKSRQMTRNDIDQTITVDRTSWLEMTLGRFRITDNHAQTTRLPGDIPMEYQDHIQALVRIQEPDAKGNMCSSFLNTSPDHYAHADNYAEMGLPIAYSTENVTTISEDMV